MKSTGISRNIAFGSVVNYAILTLIGALMIIPLLTILATSLSSAIAVDKGLVQLWPVEFTTESWKHILGMESLWKSFGLNVLATVAGTFNAMLFTSLMAYPLAKSEFKAGKVIMLMIVIIMIFKAPVIPYFLVLKSYGLYNSFWVLILPHTIVAYNLIILRTFFKQIPIELEEAAKMEGCGYFQTLFRIVFPVSKPAIVTVTLFYAVMIWNQFMHPIMFIEDQSLYPLQLKLREFITSTNFSSLIESLSGPKLYSDRTLRAAVVLYSTIPIVLVYPFIQKYFEKGAMLGSVKE